MDQHYFCIRLSHDYNHKVECPICGVELRVRTLEVYECNNEAICYLCAWQEAPALANLLHLAEAADGFHERETPPEVCEAMSQRENDPKRLKKALHAALVYICGPEHDVPEDGFTHTSPLANIVVERIQAALDAGDAETMQCAKRLFEESKSQLPCDGMPF